MTDLKHSENHKHRFNGRGKPLPYKLTIHKNPPSSQPLQNRHHTLLCTITLASLVKGRWIDSKAQALILLLSACDMPTIFMLQTFCRQDGGIAQQPLSPHHPFQNRTIPCFAPSHLPPLSKVRCCHPKKFGRLPEGLSLHQPSQTRTIPRSAPRPCLPSKKGRWHGCRGFSACCTVFR